MWLENRNPTIKHQNHWRLLGWGSTGLPRRLLPHPFATDARVLDAPRTRLRLVVPEEDERLEGVTVGRQGDFLHLTGHGIERLTQTMGLITNLVELVSGGRQLDQRAPGSAQIVVATPPRQELFECGFENRMQGQPHAFPL